MSLGVKQINWKQALAWTQQLQQPAVMERAVRVTNVVLILALAYTLAQLTWRIPPPVIVERTIPAVAKTVASKTGDVAASTQKDIAQWHLFGKVDLSAPAPVVEQPLVETALPLELRGILGSTDASQARAIIAEQARDESFYSIGGSLPGGATLKEIHNDYVILLRGGRMETLRLPKDKIDTGAAPVSSSRAQPAVPATNNNMVEPAPTADGMERRFSGSESLREMRDTMMNDPQMLAGLLRAEPVEEEGVVTGFRLSDSQDPRMLRRFGLQRGDVITSINDVKLDGPNKVPDLLRILPNAAELRIEYKRNNKPRSIVLNMDQ